MFLSLSLSFQERDAKRGARGGHKSRMRRAACREFREFLAAGDFSQPREKIPRDRRIKHVRECRCPRRQMRRFTACGGGCVAVYYSAIVVRHTRAVYLTHSFPRRDVRRESRPYRAIETGFVFPNRHSLRSINRILDPSIRESVGFLAASSIAPPPFVIFEMR